MKILATNAKLEKVPNSNKRYVLAGCTMAPAKLSGFEVCAGRSNGCTSACSLWFSGRRVTDPARERAKFLTRWYFEDREGFISQLDRDIVSHMRSAENLGAIPGVRLNMASDLDWTEFIARWGIMLFWDYTKIRSRFSAYLAGDLPPNYNLVFSRHEGHHTATLRSFLRRGGNIAQVFDVPYHPQSGKYGELPRELKVHGEHFPVIDGDLHDLRIPQLDGEGVVVGLRLKGTNKAKDRARKSGFAFTV